MTKFFESAISLLEKDKLIPVKITILGEPERTEPSEFNPIGYLGVRLKVENKLFGEKKWFLKAQECEDMMAYGPHIATQMLQLLYQDEWNEFLAKHSGLM